MTARPTRAKKKFPLRIASCGLGKETGWVLAGGGGVGEGRVVKNQVKIEKSCRPEVCLHS